MPNTLDPPLISIVIPVHQQAPFVAASIESCLGQTYPRVEVIVVDDVSTDESGEIARRYEPDVRVIRMPRNVGSCEARNAGLEHVNGEFVLFHDSDDILFPAKLSDDFEALRRHDDGGDDEDGEGGGVVISANRWFAGDAPLDCDSRPLCHRERRLLRHTAEGAASLERAIVGLLRYGGPQHSCMLYRTSLVRELGGFTDGSEPYADRELLFRVLCRKTPVVLNPRITCGWRIYTSEHRMTSRMRDLDYERRLMLARRYQTILADGGLLDQRPLRRALIHHVISRVYDYASRDRRTEVASAALQLVARLTV